MTPLVLGACQATMRLAFTRAFTGRLNVLPVQDALWQIFGTVAYEFGSTAVLLDPVFQEDVLELTASAVKLAQAEQEFKRLSSGLGAEDRKLAKVWCPGLGQVLGMQMLNYARQYGKDFLGIKTKRTNMLADRRNQMANSLASAAIERAATRVQQIGRTDRA